MEAADINADGEGPDISDLLWLRKWMFMRTDDMMPLLPCK
jgi:hypothetical protein